MGQKELLRGKSAGVADQFAALGWREKSAKTTGITV
jgi:hypothetical protein